MKDKKLLIVENCSSKLNYEQDSDSIVLTGLFTTFATKNRNGRIYESADFLPHVEALQEQMKAGALLGELDHPHSFETTLSNVSHVVESLEFDPQQNAIVGKVRLLNTSKGKEAQALVKDGIPLHISSRAAGTVDESGRVRLQQLFTYDLVAEPGFANARLKRINESFGFSNDGDVAIFDLSEDMNTDLVPEIGKEGNQLTINSGSDQATKNNNVGTVLDRNNNSDNMENPTYISYSDFQKYSEHLSEIITDLQSTISNYKTEFTNFKKNAPTMQFDSSVVDNSAINDLIAKEVSTQLANVATVKTKPATTEGNEDTSVVDNPETVCNDSDECGVEVKDLLAKTEAMEEKYSNLVKYVTYLGETLDKSITHQDYITEETNKIIDHNNYLAENMNKMISHQDYIVENLNDTINYQNYVAEMLDKSIDYSNMLAEEQNKTIKHSDYLVEKMNQMVHHQDYLAENMDKMIGHQDYLAENMNKMNQHDNVETSNNVDESPINENVNTTPVENTTVIKESFDSKKYQNEISEKLSSLISNVKTQYEETKRKEAEAIEESKKNVENPKNFTLINYIPTRLQEKWSKLSNERKEEILAESKLFVINSPQTAEYFWNTRDLRETQIQIQKIEENVTAQPSAPVNESVLTDDRYKMLAEQIKMRMRRY